VDPSGYNDVYNSAPKSFGKRVAVEMLTGRFLPCADVELRREAPCSSSQHAGEEASGPPSRSSAPGERRANATVT
jgi:hypothetical protein